MERPGRGRRGMTRYKKRIESVITLGEFRTMMEKIEIISMKSLLTILYYLGLRVAEIVGDGPRKWKKLTDKGLALSNLKELQKDWKETEEGDLWYWKHRGSLPGIVKENITLDGNILRIYSKPLKHGKREDPGGGLGALELDVNYPYVELIVDQWKRTNPGEKVWDMTTWNVWYFISKIRDGLYPHAFRVNRATRLARDPTIAISDMKHWFGWARGETADRYILPARSVTRVMASIRKELE